jgi:hypothetical protein
LLAFNRSFYPSGHVPAGQEPAGQVPAGQEKESPRPPFVPALKTENCFSGRDAPHFGHLGAGAERLRARCSNVLPHFLHLYS